MFLIYPLSEKQKVVLRLLEDKNAQRLKRYVKSLKKQGVNCLDICFQNEKRLFFVLDALKGIDIDLSIDTHNRYLLKSALKRANFVFINSSYPARENLKFYFRLANEYRTCLVILSVHKREVAIDVRARKSLIDTIVKESEEFSFPQNRLFIDVVILPYRYYPEYMYVPLLLASYIRKHFPDIRTLAGLDNFTYKEPSNLLKKMYYLLLAPAIDACITTDFFL
ncbi:MAG: hypothetical protein JSW40_03200 [Candidatus Omnitrophota bacterium]|nr:MAG: hypothetical protein JSW40_03200 [Candidatus Omnitrophota bacterium]